jgi:Organic solute transporter Ostalpha
MVIAFMAGNGWIPSVYCLSSGDVATGLQNFLMCFEMCVVALIHIIAYPYLSKQQ